MIPALLCFLVPIAGGCGDYVRDVPSASAIVANPAYYNGHTVSISGRVSKLDQWTSRTGYDQETFLVCDGECVHVYMSRHSPVHDGERVTVRGQYFQAYHVGRRTFHNEIEGTEVLPRE